MAKWWMDDAEIARSYRTAANKKEQIKVIAELNATTREEAVKKLKEIGCVVEETAAGKPRKKRVQMDETAARRLIEAGTPDGFAAEQLGVSLTFFTAWRRENGLYRRERKKEEKNVVHQETELCGMADFGAGEVGAAELPSEEEANAAYPTAEVAAAFDEFAAAFGGVKKKGVEEDAKEEEKPVEIVGDEAKIAYVEKEKQGMSAQQLAQILSAFENMESVAVACDNKPIKGVAVTLYYGAGSKEGPEKTEVELKV